MIGQLATLSSVERFDRRIFRSCSLSLLLHITWVNFMRLNIDRALCIWNIVRKTHYSWAQSSLDCYSRYKIWTQSINLIMQLKFIVWGLIEGAGINGLTEMLIMQVQKNEMAVKISKFKAKHNALTVLLFNTAFYYLIFIHRFKPVFFRK